jgi:Na+/H+ antiporter NhaD/arsenite permease-like protein
VVVAVLTFAVAVAAIVSGKLDRTKVVLIAAALLVVAGVVGQREAADSIDFGTVGLLAGMMVIVTQSEKTGLYDYLAVHAARLSGARPFRLFASLSLITALLSALLPNLTVVLLVVPISFVLADTLEISPFPFVIAEVMASNIGGAATLIGDPPNLLIGGATGLSFDDFLVNLAPVAAAALVATTLLLYFLYRDDLQSAETHRSSLIALDARTRIRDAQLLRRQAPVLAAVLAGFFLGQAIDLEPVTVALSGAALILVLSRQRIAQALADIDWSTLLFFIGLFVLVGALREKGALEHVAKGITNLTEDSFPATILVISWGSAFGSALIDNIPFTTAMIPVVDHVQHLSGRETEAHWWALAIGADLGANVTLIGGAANLVAAGIAERAGHPISFWSFMKVGLLVTMATMTIATGYLWLRYL